MALKEQLLTKAREMDGKTTSPFVGNSVGVRVVDNPTPYAPAYSPAPVQTQTAQPQEHKLSRDGFAMDEDLGAQYGSYENYLNDIVTDEYKRRATEAVPLPVKSISKCFFPKRLKLSGSFSVKISCPSPALTDT